MNIDRIIDINLDKAQYYNGAKVNITIEYINSYTNAFLVLDIIKDFKRVETFTLNIEKCDTLRKIEAEYLPSKHNWQGFGIECNMIQGRQTVSTATNAFDVVDDYRLCPRYGFVSDFSLKDEKNFEDIAWLNKLHINVIQFYDWMYRQEKLLPETEYFEDSMGRKLSIIAVKNKILDAHKKNMKVTAYGAIYAASKNFYETHKEWGMYDNEDKEISLSEWFYLMDISSDGEWADYITNQFVEAIRELDFDGIHLDTYGFPKKYYTHSENRQLIDFSDVINGFINKVKDNVTKVKPSSILIYNNVNNFPTKSVVKSIIDAIYIEVWPPSTTYNHLYKLCSYVRAISNRPIILAAYIKPLAEDDSFENKEATLLLASAVIFASGSYHLVMGGYQGALDDSYYAKYSLIENPLGIRNYYDYITRFGHIFLDPELKDITMLLTGGINEEYKFVNCYTSVEPQSDKVWTLIKENKNYIIIHLINLTGISNVEWNTMKHNPCPVQNIEVDALIYDSIKAIHLTSPDLNGINQNNINYIQSLSNQGLRTQFIVPNLDIWATIFIEKE